MKMKDTILSNCEREFIQEAVIQDKRIDGRHAYEFRNLEILFGSNYGCCQISIGKTRAIAQVSAEVIAPQASRPSEGLIYTNVEFNPMASPQFEPGKPSEAAVEVSRIVERCIKESRCVDLESLCIVTGSQVWQIRVDVHIISHEGNLTDCACLAAITALLHFRRADVTVSGEEVVFHSVENRDPVPLSIHHIPICITFAFFDNGNRLLIDPNEREECAMEGKMIFGMNSHREICTLHMGGRMLLLKDQVLRCSEIAVVRVNEMTSKIKKCIVEDSNKRKERKNVGFEENINLNRITVNKLPSTKIISANFEESVNSHDEIKEIEYFPKIVIKGPGTVGLNVGSGGSNKWVEISDDDDKEMEVDETNLKQSNSPSFSSKNMIETTGEKKIDKDSDEEDIVVLNSSELKSDCAPKVDLTKALRKKKNKT